MKLKIINHLFKYAITIIALLPVSVHAIEDEEIALCSSDENPITRLECFDQLASKHSLSPKTIIEKKISAGDWQTQASKDPFTDKDFFAAGIMAESGQGRFGEPIIMAVRCHNNKTELYINWNSYLGRDPTEITHRIDKEASQKSKWLISNDGKATFFRTSPIPLLKKMADSSSFIVNVIPYRDNPITAIFNTKGADIAFSEIRKSCNW